MPLYIPLIPETTKNATTPGNQNTFMKMLRVGQNWDFRAPSFHHKRPKNKNEPNFRDKPPKISPKGVRKP